MLSERKDEKDFGLMTNIKMAAARQGYSQGARPKQREDEGLERSLVEAARRREDVGRDVDL